MGEIPIIAVKTELFIHNGASRAFLADAVAVYDNSINSIGYTLYNYASEMSINEGAFKFIRVDGVSPSENTITSGEYPLLYYYNAVFDKRQPINSPARAMVSWLISADGQKAVKTAGYIPIREVDAEAVKITDFLYNEKGTGREINKDEYNDGWYYTVDIYRTPFKLMAYNEKTKHNEFRGLKDKDLLNKINNFIEEAENSFPDEYITETSFRIVNGYLFINVFCSSAKDSDKYFYDGKVGYFDLYEGTQIELTDLFYKESDFISSVNGSIINQINITNSKNSNGREIKLMRPFEGITKDVIITMNEYEYEFEHVNKLNIIFPSDNIYFGKKTTFIYNDIGSNMLIADKSRSMDGIFTDDVIISSSGYTFYDENNVYTVAEGNITREPISAKGYDFSLVSSDYKIMLRKIYLCKKDIAEKLNNVVLSYIYNNISAEKLSELAKVKDLTKADIDCNVDGTIDRTGKNIILVYISGYVEVARSDVYLHDSFSKTFIFDINTGTEYSYNDLLLPDFKAYNIMLEEVPQSDLNGLYVDYIIPDKVRIYNNVFKILFTTADNSILHKNATKNDNCLFYIPEEYFNWDILGK
jgi:hypothetical protein